MSEWMEAPAVTMRTCEMRMRVQAKLHDTTQKRQDACLGEASVLSASLQLFPFAEKGATGQSSQNLLKVVNRHQTLRLAPSAVPALCHEALNATNTVKRCLPCPSKAAQTHL